MTILAVCGLSLGILAVAILARKIGMLRRELEQSEGRLGRRLFRVQGRLAEMESLVQELDFERRRARGEIRIDSATKVEEAFMIHPKVREILGTYGISGGGCSGGSLDEGQSIAEACVAVSVDPAAVIDSLRRFVADPRSAPGASDTLQAKLYRIERAPGK